MCVLRNISVIFLSFVFAFMEIFVSSCKLNVKDSVTKSWIFVITHIKKDATSQCSLNIGNQRSKVC